MTTLTIENQEIREKRVKEGIDFLLSHFEGRQRLFPRKMSHLQVKENNLLFIIKNKFLMHVSNQIL